MDCGLALSKGREREEMEVLSMMAWAVWFEICKRIHDSSGQKTVIQID